MPMAKELSPCERYSNWVQDEGKKKRWCVALKATGPEQVQIILQQSRAGSAGDVVVGGEFMTRGFAEEWLAWHHNQRREEERSYRRKRLLWIIIPVVLAVLGAVFNWAWHNL